MSALLDKLDEVNAQLEGLHVYEGRPIAMVCGGHIYAGELLLRDQRVSELLNDSSETEFIRMSDVAVFRKSQVRRLTKLLQLVIPKQQVDFAMLLDENHENHRAYRRVEKESVPVFLVAGGCEIRGMLPLTRVSPTGMDPVRVLTEQTPRFFPVTQANLTQFFQGACWRQNAPVVMVNTASVDSFAVGDAT